MRETIEWPKNSWTMLERIIKAWYAAEEDGSDFTQKKIAEMSGLQPSQVSVNKPFLRDIGIVQAEGLSLTDAGKRLGLGLSLDNDRAKQQGLQEVVKGCWLLKEILDLVRGRGSLSEGDFEFELSLRTKQGKNTPGFTSGIAALKDILVGSGLVQIEANLFKPIKGQQNGDDESKTALKSEPRSPSVEVFVDESGLRKIPIPVSASSVWYIYVAANPGVEEIDRFIEMQQLIFGTKKLRPGGNA
jgi:hypothetical protein